MSKNNKNKKKQKRASQKLINAEDDMQQSTAAGR